MGRMKELFTDLQESNVNQKDIDNTDFQNSAYITETPCPNCLTAALIQTSLDDYVCDKCGYEYIKVGENNFTFR